MSVLPWWGKILGKVVLSRLPFGYQMWQALGLFRHGQMDKLNYVKKIFDGHVNSAGLTGLLYGKTILELGPGDSIATAIIASCYGARAILVDAGSFALVDINVYKNMAFDLQKLGLSPPKEIFEATSMGELLLACKSAYLVHGLKSLSDISSESVDFIFSQAVLEHVRRHEFFATIIELRRIIAPKGTSSHRIDLRDHLGGGLNNLRFNGAIWESNFFVKSGFYTNRIQCEEMLSYFRDSGFNVEVSSIARWKSMPISRASLAPQFRTLSPEELSVSGFEVLLTPAATCFNGA